MRSFIQPKYGWEAIPYKNDSAAMTDHISDLFLRVYEDGNGTFKKGTQEVLSYSNFLSLYRMLYIQIIQPKKFYTQGV